MRLDAEAKGKSYNDLRLDALTAALLQASVSSLEIDDVIDEMPFNDFWDWLKTKAIRCLEASYLPPALTASSSDLLAAPTSKILWLPKQRGIGGGQKEF